MKIFETLLPKSFILTGKWTVGLDEFPRLLSIDDDESSIALRNSTKGQIIFNWTTDGMIFLLDLENTPQEILLELEEEMEDYLGDWLYMKFENFVGEINLSYIELVDKSIIDLNDLDLNNYLSDQIDSSRGCFLLTIEDK